MATKCDLSDGGPCFICGSPDLASKAQPRRRYAELTTLFKTLVMTTDLQKNLADSVYSDFTINVESCFNCLATIKDVCDLRQEIVTLQTELDRLLEGARIKLGNILPNPNLEQKASRISERTSSRKGKKLMGEEDEVVQVKEEFQDCEIIPDFVDSTEIEPSIEHEMMEDAEFGNNSPSEDETQDHDSDYIPPSSASKSFKKVNPDLSSSLDQKTMPQITEILNCDDDTSSSESDGENVVTKKSRKIMDWENVVDFNSMEEARKYIFEMGGWVYKNTYQTKEGIMVAFVCKQSRSCSSKWRINHPSNSTVMYVEKTIGEHDHVPKKGRGISQELKQEIIKLLESGTKKPRAILSTLRRGGVVELPKRSQLVNFLATYKKR